MFMKILECNTTQHLTWLKYAPLLNEPDVRQCSSIEDSVYPSLVVLTLLDLPNMRSIHERVLSFTSLRSIQVDQCENLEKLPFHFNSAKAKLRNIDRGRSRVVGQLGVG
ncbi:hypothetical protein K1719_024589 [Acacia pycnantha]|nr:hypothetical protein K1719_024589 [Acacia pycnantha]